MPHKLSFVIMIPRANILRLVAKLTKNGKRFSEKTIEKDYVLSWLLVGMSKTKLNEVLAFKGGTALKKVYIKGFRFSEDLDFTLLNQEFTKEHLKAEFQAIFPLLLDMVNIPLAFRKDIEEHLNTFTFYINYSGPLRADISRGEIKVDVTINEKIITPNQFRTLLREYDEYNDLPPNVKINTYSIEEMGIEKLCSVLDPKRNEPRDVYDLWYLLDSGLIELSSLVDNFRIKAKYKNLKINKASNLLNNKQKIYQRSWDIKLKHQLIAVPLFKETYRQLKRFLRQAGII